MMEDFRKKEKHTFKKLTQCEFFCKLWIFLKVTSNCISPIIFSLQPIADLPFTENTFGNGY